MTLPVEYQSIIDALHRSVRLMDREGHAKRFEVEAPIFHVDKAPFVIKVDTDEEATKIARVLNRVTHNTDFAHPCAQERDMPPMVMIAWGKLKENVVQTIEDGWLRALDEVQRESGERPKNWGARVARRAASATQTTLL